MPKLTELLEHINDVPLDEVDDTAVQAVVDRLMADDEGEQPVPVAAFSSSI